MKRLHSIATKFILSYFLVLIIPLILIVSVIYGMYNKMLSEKVCDALETSLLQTRNVLDSHMATLLALPGQIQRGAVLYNILNSYSSNRYSSYDFSLGIKELGRYMPMDNFVNEIIVYNTNDRKIITTTMMTDEEMFFDNIYEYTDLPRNEFLQYIRQVNEISLLSSENVRIGGGKRPTQIITFVRPLFFNDSSPKDDIKLVVTINKNAISRFVSQTITHYDGAFYILDKNNNIITEEAVPQTAGYCRGYADGLQDKQINTYGFQNVVIEKKTFMVYTMPSQEMELTYMYIVPQSIIYEELNQVRNFSFAIISVACIIGIGLSVLFTYRDYLPIRNLLRILYTEETAANILPEDKNEWSVIGKRLMQTLSSKRELEETMESHYDSFRESFYRALLFGWNINDTSLNSLLLFFHIETENMHFCAMDISIEILPDSLVQESYLCRFIVINVIEEICHSIGEGLIVQIGDRQLAVLFCLPPSQLNQCEEKITEISDSVNQFIQTHYNLKIHSGIGKPCQYIKDIHCSYNEARQALERSILLNETSAPERINIRKSAKNVQLTVKIIDYINKEFSNPNLSLSSIADAFDLSPSYVSRFLKEAFNENFKDYLQAKRITEAKILLCESKLSISEISNEVGYTNTHSFINNFKKMEGKTPGSYRNEMEKNI